MKHLSQWRLCSRFLNGDNEMKRIFGSKVVKLAQRYNLHACLLPTLFPYWTFAYTASSVATIRATIEPQSKPSCYYFVLLMMVMINSMVTPRDSWPRLEKLGVCDDIFIHITTSCMGLKIMVPVTGHFLPILVIWLSKVQFHRTNILCIFNGGVVDIM